MKLRHLLPVLLFTAVSPAEAQLTSITPGETWKDTNSSAINAHGGCVQYHDGYYYWFGEYRSSSSCAGVSCYRSADLYNWTKLSLALTPTGTQTDEGVDIASGRTLERPKVIYCAATGKWVMWIHWENGDDYTLARVAVCQADTIVGPYTLVDVFRPNSCDSRDQTLFLDDDGKAYHVYSTNTNSNTNCEQLSDDFLTPLEDYNTQLSGRKYEAACIFKTGEQYYGLFSGCTGWTPNPGRIMFTNDLMGDWEAPADFKASDNTTGTNFCVDDGASTSYTSQSAYVFPVQGKERYFVYMGDRWTSSNIQNSTYVWLPLSVRSGYPAVRWYDSWDLSVFDDMYQLKRAAELQDSLEFYFVEKWSNRVVSRPSSTLVINDDGDSNVLFRLHATDDPQHWKIENTATGKYMQSVYGTTRWYDESDDEGQEWIFSLLEDGYYNVTNASDSKVMSVSGNGTESGTSVYLNTLNSDIHQCFAVYFDSEAHPEYEEADMWGATYRDDNLVKMAEQEEALAISSTPVERLGISFSSGGLTLSSPVTTSAQIRVLEAGSGRLMYVENTTLAVGETTLDTTLCLPRGIYIVSVQTGSGNVIRKVAL